MKKNYATPKVEKIEFDYTDVVVASGNHKGDNGNGHGCGKKSSIPEGSSIVMAAKNGGSTNA